ATNGPQFFITRVATPHLNTLHTILAHTNEGQDVVKAIVQGDVIESINIVSSGSDARNFDAVKVFRDAQEEKTKKNKEAEEKAFKAESDMATRITDLKAQATKTSTGLSYYVFEKGSNEKANEGELVNVYYAGYFENGKLFD